jgi:hypothetical protein
MKEENIEVQKLKDFSHAEVASLKDKPDVIVVKATKNYIPMRVFQPIFDFVVAHAKEKKVSKVIFDKRTLSVFHQPSMEWYFLDWKDRMSKVGCKVHRKLLPDDQVFIQSVKIAREKLNKDYQQAEFQKLDIQYADSLQEAIDK